MKPVNKQGQQIQDKVQKRTWKKVKIHADNM